ncbi:response regulator transcription factor [Agriterribacter sp.]|uniref:response regulator transcription factor n=1 Tax=Agriterribacter sp. TaxID=2821509 RepID=UPI002C5583F5|nr:response regulator transcription factor [Agriterribacter sp.]HRP54937.1 response regulator transcription factor [Agriterribacter sp.]
MLRILIADDHEFIRKGLKQILTEEYPDVYIEEAEDTATAVAKAFSGPWHLVITDISMPGGGGLEALNRIKQRLPQIPVLVLSIYPEDQFALRVLLAGASGYLNKDSAPEILIRAVKTILAGEKYLLPGVEVLPHMLLNVQETIVFRWLANERTVAEIATFMLLEAHEVDAIRQRVLQKMNLQTNGQLAEYSKKNNLA